MSPWLKVEYPDGLLLAAATQQAYVLAAKSFALTQACRGNSFQMLMHVFALQKSFPPNVGVEAFVSLDNFHSRKGHVCPEIMQYCMIAIVFEADYL